VPPKSAPDEAPVEAADVPAVPAVDTPVAEPPPAEEQPEPAPEWGNWRYTGTGHPRTYTNVPVTPETGDVVGWWGPPGTDGCWEPTDADPTRMPDNWRPDLSDAEHAKLRGDTTDES